MTVSALAADPTRVRCVAEEERVYPNGSLGAGEQRLAAIDAKQYSTRYGKIAKRTFGAVDVRAALVPNDEPDAERGEGRLHAGFAVHDGATRYYELVGRHGTPIVVGNNSPSDEERAHEPRIGVVFAGDPSLPLLRLEWTGSYMGAHASGGTRTNAFLDFHGTPRIAQVADCYDGWMGGACTAFDELYSSHEFFDCAWSAADADVICRVTQKLDAVWTHRASTRRFEVFAGRELPVREHSLRSLEALARAPRGEHFVEGVGLVKPVGTIARRWFVYASAGTGHALVARLWSVDLRDPKGPIRPVPVQLLDAADPELQVSRDDVAAEKDWRGEPLPRFTPDALPFRIESRRVTPGTSPDVLELVLHDGRARGVFWIGGDATSGAIDAFRVSSDADEYASCHRFVRPPSAASVVVGLHPFSAKLRITPASTDDLSADEHTEPPSGPLSPATVTWSSGFQITRNQ
jgi:hypothetical protein